MKGVFSKVIILIAAIGLSSSVFANTKMNNQKWTCETNASSASTDADKKADEQMSDKAMSAKEAFAFAFKHCRDCTKITCSAQTE